MLAEVLLELKELNRKFQFDLVDITSIASTIDVTINFFMETLFGCEFWHNNQTFGYFFARRGAN